MTNVFISSKMIAVEVVSAEFKLSCLPFSHCVSRQLFKTESHHLQRKLNQLCFSHFSVRDIWKTDFQERGPKKRNHKVFHALWKPLEVYLHFISLLLLLLAIGSSEAAFSLFPQRVKNLGSVQNETHFSPFSLKGAFLYLMGVFPNPHQSSFHSRYAGQNLKPKTTAASWKAYFQQNPRLHS